MDKTKLSWNDVARMADNLKAVIAQKVPRPKVYPVPRGGIYAALLLGFEIVDSPDKANVIVDDLIDSGSTKAQHEVLYPDKPFYALLTKAHDDLWIEFPWERNQRNPHESVTDNVSRILQYLGEDVSREGLLETPKRYIKAMEEFLSPPEFNMTTFQADSQDMIIVDNITFESMCEHHLFPFHGVGHIGYIPTDKMVGISKIPRTLELFSRRLQNQERIGSQVADHLMHHLQPKGVIVILEAAHMCMCMRGVRKPGAMTKTSALRGLFCTDSDLRNEFLQLIK